MTILRRFGLLICASLFCGCLAGVAFLAGLHGVFTSPQPLKTALQNSGIYEEITPNIINAQMATSPLPLRDIGVKNALTQALSASFYQGASEQIIDGTYSWMSGGTASPKFSVDTTAVKNDFASNIATYIRQQMDSLPACERDTAPPTSAKDALSLTCLPQHVTPDMVADTARQQILANSLLVQGDSITPTTLKDGQGRTFQQQLAFMPWLYRAYLPALLLLPLLGALLGVAIVFLSATKRAGLRRVAWLVLSTGLVTLVLAVAGMELFHMGVRVFGLPGTLAFETQDKLVSVIELLGIDAQPWWLGIGAGYALLGAGLFSYLWLRRPKQRLKFSS